MYNDKKILAIIPARWWSKWIKNKNIVKLLWKPLIYYSIELALKLENIIDKIVVNTDSEKILSIIKNFKVDKLKRPYNLATDDSKMRDVIKFTTDYYDNYYDIIVLLQPTSPIRSVSTVINAIKDFIDNIEKYDSLMPLTHTTTKVWIIENNLYIPNIKWENNRQNLIKNYSECWTIFIYKKELLNKENIIWDRIYPFIIQNKFETFDIDNIQDLEINKIILKYNNELWINI